MFKGANCNCCNGFLSLFDSHFSVGISDNNAVALFSEIYVLAIAFLGICTKLQTDPSGPDSEARHQALSLVFEHKFQFQVPLLSLLPILLGPGQIWQPRRIALVYNWNKDLKWKNSHDKDERQRKASDTQLIISLYPVICAAA